MTILELREKRAKAWDAAKAFLDSHRTDKGTLSAEDDAAYSRMEQDITDLGKEIARMERREALDAELNKPVSQPITGKPAGDQQAEKKGRASDEYKRNFWNAMRLQGNPYEIRNALQEGTDSEGGYLVPDEYERTLVQALEEENVFRRLAKVIQTSSGDRKIPIVTSHGTAVWLDEEDALTESDEVFDQTSLSAYKLGTFLKVSDELLNDSVFDLPSYISTEFARRIGAKEEEAFFVGDGSGKATGIFAATGGAQTGVTAASSTAITADELIDLFYSLKSPYRRKAVWVMNDSTFKAIRKLKDKGVEAYFEKENIWTFDGKGELMLTIMSSLAQEESRSISENYVLGQRKLFADGKVTVPFGRFLVYDKGPDGNLIVNEEQAMVVRRMHWLLDVHYSEDYCRIANKTAQQNLNLLRKFALSLLKLYKVEPDEK